MFIKFQNKNNFKFKNTSIIKGMVEIYDIMNITCQNLPIYYIPVALGVI